MDIYPLIVDHLRHDLTAVEEGLRVLDRWDARGFGPAPRRDQWRRLLLAAKANPQGRKALIGLLSDNSEYARGLKDYAPFAGVLSREQRRKAFLRCTYDH
jgi:hypothetical protein